MPAGRRPRVAGAVVHRRHPIPPPTVHRDLAVTDPVRTLVDLAISSTRQELAGAVDRAVAGERALTTLDRLSTATDAGRRGVRMLRSTLEEHGYLGGPSPSVLESKMARLLHRHRLPAPDAEVEVEVGSTGGEVRYRLDSAYPPMKLIVEVNGYVWHHKPEQARRDHARHNRLQGGGWSILVYTWKDVVDDGERVAAEIGDHLRRRACLPTLSLDNIG